MEEMESRGRKTGGKGCLVGNLLCSNFMSQVCFPSVVKQGEREREARLVCMDSKQTHMYIRARRRSKRRRKKNGRKRRTGKEQEGKERRKLKKQEKERVIHVSLSEETICWKKKHPLKNETDSLRRKEFPSSMKPLLARLQI